MEKKVGKKVTAVVRTSKLPREILEKAYREIQAKKAESAKGESA
ncbi:hypothetical protein [Effusibacillus pohliae]|nr:hypothetical protein [Effusibacillus pohliae]